MESIKHRIQIDFYQEAYEELEKIKTLTGATSFSETIRNALGCYKYIAGQVVKGGKVLVECKNEKDELEIREVIFPFIKLPH